MRALFIGSYPNQVDIYKNVFYRNLIYSMADIGIECHVISPISVTRYRSEIFKIQRYFEDVSPGGNIIKVYYPRYISFSSKKILGHNTMYWTIKSGASSVIKEYKKIRLEFDFTYGHFILGGGLSAARLGRKYNIPAFIAYGECDYYSEVASKHNLKKEELVGVSGIIAVSSKNMNELKSLDVFDGIPILLSLNSVDKKLFVKKNRNQCRKKFNLPQNDFIVGFVGYFKERKGYKRLLEACRDLQGVSLAFAGRGEDKPQGENVVFCDSLDHDDIPDFLNAIDVFVLPTQNEGLSNAIAEAMSCGCAIVSSDRDFNRDILNDNNSILVDPDSIDEIRSAVIRLRDDKVFRELISDRTYEDSKKYSIENRAKEILDFIKARINERGEI